MLASESTWCTMADVDAAGIIYFASALRWAERLSTGWMRDSGHPYSRLFDDGIATPAVGATADYHSHISLDDAVRLELSVSHIGRTSFTFRTEAFVGNAELPAATVKITHVFAQYTHPSQNAGRAHSRPTPIPAWLRSALQTGHRPE